MSVTSAQGFLAAGVAAGIRSGDGPDVALVVSSGGTAVAAGVFTTNRFPAAPVLYSRQVLAAGQLDAVILNAGGANACTGAAGAADTQATADHVAALLGTSATRIAVCSTGLIGERLPMNKLLAGASAAHASLSPDGGDDAAEAIRTTDTVAKTAAVTVDGVTVGGMAKGAGMLAPALATMLVVITTDAVLDLDGAQQALEHAVGLTFNRLDGDGCMSTNDTVLLLANGASGRRLPDDVLGEMLVEVCADLAEQLADDAEGASKRIEITVSGAASVADAEEAGRVVARSNLLKCAIHGQDPNWGRVLASLGTSRAAFDSDAVRVAFNGVEVWSAGALGRPRTDVDLSGRIVRIDIDLAAGDESATILTTDLTAAYVHENSAYST
jgi:glutamate N-acetyltransferase / amino-acid N-acetyltransferase